MADSLQIRPLEDRDASAVSRILKECYRFLAVRDQFSDRELSGLVETCSSPGFVRELAADFDCAVAEVDGAVVGFVACQGAMIEQLFVLPEAHRRGVGSGLFRHATDWMRERGHTRVALTTTGYGRPFYEAMGMRVTGTCAVTFGPLLGRELLRLEGPTAGQNYSDTAVV